MNDAERAAKLATLGRFLDCIQDGAQPDREALDVGIEACLLLAEKLKKRRGPTARKIFAIDTPQFGVALDYVNELIGYDEACERISTLCRSCERRTAERHLADMKPRAQRVARMVQSLKSAARING